MVCIYCGGKTQVTNSRPQKRLNQTWRRRECYSCQAIFSTNEIADLSTAISVRQKNGPTAPFNREKLLISIFRAVGHRQSPLEDASALTATITAKLLHSTAEAAVSPSDIVKIALETLQRFDTAAAVQYQAYHKVKN
jgi:transcriptional regulator NrdR family protein